MLKESALVGFVATSRPADARAFYEQVLGLRCCASDAYALVFEVGASQLRVQVVPEFVPHASTVIGWQVAGRSRTLNVRSGRWRSTVLSSSAMPVWIRTTSASGRPRAGHGLRG